MAKKKLIHMSNNGPSICDHDPSNPRARGCPFTIHGRSIEEVEAKYEDFIDSREAWSRDVLRMFAQFDKATITREEIDTACAAMLNETLDKIDLVKRDNYDNLIDDGQFDGEKLESLLYRNREIPVAMVDPALSGTEETPYIVFEMFQDFDRGQSVIRGEYKGKPYEYRLDRVSLIDGTVDIDKEIPQDSDEAVVVEVAEPTVIADDVQITVDHMPPTGYMPSEEAKQVNREQYVDVPSEAPTVSAPFGKPSSGGWRPSVKQRARNQEMYADTVTEKTPTATATLPVRPAKKVKQPSGWMPHIEVEIDDEVVYKAQ